MEKETNSFSKTNPWMVSTLVLLGVVVGFGASQIPYVKRIIGGGKAAVTETDPATAKPELFTPPVNVLKPEQIEKLADDDAVLGDANAPITIVEFSDFQCPYCGKFVANSMPGIKADFIDTGKVKLVFRDFPLEGHPNAMPAAMAYECANEQGKPYEMHDMIFANQTEWSPSDSPTKIFKEYAVKLGLDSAKFNECVGTKKFTDEIKKDFVDGASYGVSGTPAFFINGKEVSGAMPYAEVFKPILDAELAGKKWEIQYDQFGKPSVRIVE
jgi:protein-disulfide isomerase